MSTMKEPSAESARRAGLKEGLTDAKLEEHAKHLAKINGSIADAAAANQELAAALRDVASEVRTLQEQGRLAAERVNVAAETLAKETERRRETLALEEASRRESEQKASSAGDRKFSKGTWFTGITLTVVLALTGFYLSTRAHTPTPPPTPTATVTATTP